jgi:hypothetical protein
MNWLGQIFSPSLAPAVLLLIGALIGTIGAAMGPETRDVDM